MKPVLSWDAETNGLWGRAFAIGAVLIAPDTDMKIFRARIPLHNPMPWIRENILPHIDNIRITHEKYEDMLADFASFLNSSIDASIIVHMGYIVEAKILRDMYDLKLITEFGAPYPLLDVSGHLEMAGHDPTSVDRYLNSMNIHAPGNPHDPVFDSLQAALAYIHLQHPDDFPEIKRRLCL